MNSPIDAYHDFVDALVARRECVLAKRVQTAWRWPAESSFAKFNSLVEGLSQAQRDLLAALLQEARDGGIHDVLAEVSERANLKGFGLVRKTASSCRWNLTEPRSTSTGSPVAPVRRGRMRDNISFDTDALRRPAAAPLTGASRRSTKRYTAERRVAP
jgi:hypothetical protein